MRKGRVGRPRLSFEGSAGQFTPLSLATFHCSEWASSSEHTVHLSRFGQENRSHSRLFFNIGTRIHHFCCYRAGRVEGQGSSHYSECVPGAHLESAVIWTVGAAAADLSG